MSGPCPADFQRLAAEVGGFTCDQARPVIQIRNPFGLTNWTLPVLEALIVGCAVLALIYAVRRFRHDGDRIPLVMWCAPVVYLLVIEPPVYFPDLVGAEKSMGVVFVHNVFTVEFLWDRLPLYIVAIYPALMVLAYEIVRAFGIFTRRGILAGSVAVCFVHHCFYEVFDHLGPQLNWWLWNTQSDANQPAIAAVPLNSIFLFATLGPGLITAVVLSMAKRRNGTGLDTPVRLIGAIIVAGFSAPIGVMLGGIPGRLAGSGGDHPNVGAQAVVLIALTAVLLAAGAWVLARAYWDRREQVIAPLPTIMWTSGALFAVVFAVLWASSLPEYLSAVGGVTGRGTAIGNLPYAAASFVAVLLLLAAVRPRSGDALPGQHRDTDVRRDAVTIKHTQEPRSV
jgi:uncharacterized membrane protein YidH (DUF202 family)